MVRRLLFVRIIRDVCFGVRHRRILMVCRWIWVLRPRVVRKLQVGLFLWFSIMSLVLLVRWLLNGLPCRKSLLMRKVRLFFRSRLLLLSDCLVLLEF